MKRFLVILFLVLVMSGLCSCYGLDPEVSIEVDFLTLFELREYDDYISLTKIHDNHGGLQNDGAGFYVVSIEKCSSDMFEEWESLPFDDIAEHLAYGGNFDGLPEIKNGRYKYIDRNPESNSTNVSMFVYDEDNEIGYYLVLDT